MYGFTVVSVVHVRMYMYTCTCTCIHVHVHVCLYEGMAVPTPHKLSIGMVVCKQKRSCAQFLLLFLDCTILFPLSAWVLHNITVSLTFISGRRRPWVTCNCTFESVLYYLPLIFERLTVAYTPIPSWASIVSTLFCLHVCQARGYVWWALIGILSLFLSFFFFLFFLSFIHFWVVCCKQ